MANMILNGVEYLSGGGSNYVELTKAEYDQLTEARKTDGTLYFITDVNNDSDIKISPIIYSTEERRIGVWIDGKPLYEQSFRFDNTVNWTNGLLLDTGLTNIDTIFVHEAFFNDANQTSFSSLMYRQPTGGALIGLNASTSEKGKLILTVSSTFTANNSRYIIARVRYTKTTDTAGSENYSPLGIPTSHYSIVEQVVGTWIDGRPIYQKTVNINGLPASTKDVPHNISDFDFGWVVNGYAQNPSDSTKITFNFPTTYTGASVEAWLDKNNVKIYVSTNRTTYSIAYVTIQYTKTSDVQS